MKFVTYSQWGQLPASASHLFAVGEKYSLFCSQIWLETITAHGLTEHQSILIACVEENENLLAILPMVKTTQGDQDSLSSLSNNFTTLYSPIITKNEQQYSVLMCLAVGLANSLDHRSSQAIRFEPIDPNDENMTKLRQLLESCGLHSHTFFRFYNWTHLLGGQSYDEYISERPANLRNTIKRKQRKLEREHDYEIRLFMDTDIDQPRITIDLDKAIADYNIVYKASWKASEFFSDFTPALVKSFSRRGWLRLAILYINEQPIAAQIWFVVHGKANIYRLVFDEHWKNYSPGSILTEYLMRYVIDTDKVSEIDFLTGNERYKQDWMSVRKERLGIIFSKSPKQINSFSQMINLFKKLLLKTNAKH